MTAYGKGARGKATRLHSKAVRARGQCENCGDTNPAKLQCAHIISRRYNWTRTDPTNAFCLCVKCHMRFTEWPVEFADFVETKIGTDGYQQLRDTANRDYKPDGGFGDNSPYWHDWIEQLEELIP